MKRKNVRVSTNLHKMPRHNIKNNNSMTLKLLRRNKLYAIRVEPLPTEADKPVNKRKHFAKKFKNNDFKLTCIVQFLLELDALLHKLAKTIKFIKSMKIMGILRDKINTRLKTLRIKSTTSWTIIYNMGIIISDPNTMKRNATASSSSPCPSLVEATIP